MHPAPSHDPHFRVLLVDDDDGVRNMLRLVFSFEESVEEVREAADGNEAIRVCDEFDPDVIVLDYWMPGKDGAATATEIRATHPNAKIVAFSGVLEKVPPWADQLFIKGQMPDVGQVLELPTR